MSRAGASSASIDVEPGDELGVRGDEDGEDEEGDADRRAECLPVAPGLLEEDDGR